MRLTPKRLTTPGGTRLPKTSSYGYISDEALLSLDSMEGLYAAAAKPKARPAVHAPPWWAYIPAVVVTAIAYAIHYLPLPPFRVVSASGARYPVSAAIIAILGGVLV